MKDEKPYRFTAERYKQRTGLSYACEDESLDADSLPPVLDEGTKSSPFPVSENNGLIGTTAERQEFFVILRRS